MKTYLQPLSFVVLVIIIIAVIPLGPVIDLLSLRPNLSMEQQLLQFWRLISGHIVHASFPHLFVNLVNLILLRIVFQPWLSNKRFCSFLCFSALFISIGLVINGGLNSYVGFSGIFHGLLLYLLLHRWAKSPIIFSLALLCLIGKVIHEQMFGPNLSLVNFIGINIATEAHFLGLISAVCFYCLLQIKICIQRLRA